MNLTKQILQIIITMQIAFVQARSFKRFGLVIFAVLCMPGRHTITSFIFFAKKHTEDWTKFYRFFSKRKWDPVLCFDKLAETALKEALSDSDDIIFALDDFRVEKTGKTIPYVRYQLDPKSPPFNTNLILGHRYLHAVLLINRKKEGKWQAARSISVRIQLAPHIKKPGKNATPEDLEKYKVSKKEYNLTQYASQMICELRELVTRLGYGERKITIVADGGYCNKTIFKNLPKGVNLIVRCRKDARLCGRSNNKRSFYDEIKFTPHEIYKDEKIPIGKAQVFYGRRTTEVSYKEKSEIYWPSGAQKLPLRTLVIYGVKYRKNKNGYDNYRDPLYLLTTDQTEDAELIIQYYLYRWEIEVTHRELKNDLGISQAQVRNEVSVQRCPQMVGIANSVIKLAHILQERSGVKEDYAKPPKWDKNRKRISIAYMRRKLREEITMGSEMRWKELIDNIAA